MRRHLRFLLMLLHLVAGFGLAVGLRLNSRLRGRPPAATGGPQWWFARLCRILHLRVATQGEVSQEPTFLVANHISWLDIVVLGAVAPVCFVSKVEIRAWPIFGWMAAAGGTVFIPRGANQARMVVEQVSERLASGSMVAVFPEGTTSDGQQVRRFYPRLFAAAIEIGALVQPVAITYPHPAGVHPAAPFIDDDPMMASLRRILDQPEIAVTLSFCPPVTAADRDRRGLAVETREQIVDASGLPQEAA